MFYIHCITVINEILYLFQEFYIYCITVINEILYLFQEGIVLDISFGEEIIPEPKVDICEEVAQEPKVDECEYLVEIDDISETPKIPKEKNDCESTSNNSVHSDENDSETLKLDSVKNVENDSRKIIINNKENLPVNDNITRHFMNWQVKSLQTVENVMSESCSTVLSNRSKMCSRLSGAGPIRGLSRSHQIDKALTKGQKKKLRLRRAKIPWFLHWGGQAACFKCRKAFPGRMEEHHFHGKSSPIFSFFPWFGMSEAKYMADLMYEQPTSRNQRMFVVFGQDCRLCGWKGPRCT